MSIFTIILTTTVNVDNKSFLHQIDKNDRINTYLTSIKKWLTLTNLNIIVVENSGYTFEELNEEKEKYKKRFEVISFVENEAKDSKYLNTHHHIKLSKGASELFAIDYVYFNSEIIFNSLFVIKITGRYYIPNFENYLYENKVNEYKALRQNNNGRCEVIGVSLKYFHKIFNKYPICGNGYFYDHIEEIYEYRINLMKKENIFTCKPLEIEPTQQGGCNIIITLL